MNIYQLRHLAGREEIDYTFIASALQKYAHPRQKISTWLKNKDLIRVKKGLYIFGPKISQHSYSKELLANLIYGPSAISLAYALSYYGLIPERIETITSITNNRNKKIHTPVGEFSYQYLSNERYQHGIEIVNIGQQQSFFIAIAEKALCDYLYIATKTIKILSLQELKEFMFADLRIDKNVLTNLSLNKVRKIAEIYKSPIINLFKEYFEKEVRVKWM